MSSPTRFDLAYAALAPLALPYVAWRWGRGKYRESGPAMFGRGLPEGEAARPFDRGSLWIHAVSVGEVAAARAVAPGLRSLLPVLPLVVSTVTETGQAAARRDLPDASTTYLPADLSFNVRRFLRTFRPRAVVILEAELWPNFTTLARASGASVFQINGRLSDRSFPRYRAVRGLLRPVFDAFDGFCVQTETDAARYRALGIAPERIRVTGNCKFDLKPAPLVPDERARRRAELGFAAEAPLVVAGSTHPGEDEIVLAALAVARRDVPGARLLLVPRHPERFGAVAELARRSGFAARLASAGAPSAGEPAPDVVVLDRMGELARAYGLGEVAIVAGSFGAVGGHNLLEAAAHAVPVVFGPNMRSQREIAHLFAAGGAGVQVSAEELGPRLSRLLTHPEERRTEGRKCLRVLEENQGSANRATEALRAWLAAAPEQGGSRSWPT